MAVAVATFAAKNAFGILDTIFQAAKEISNCAVLLKINISQEDELLEQIGLLHTLLQDLRAELDARKEEPTKGMIRGLGNIERQMEKCRAYCKPSGERTDHNKVFLELCTDGMEKKKFSIEKCAKYASELWNVKERNEITKSLQEGLGSAIRLIQFILRLEDTERITKKEKEEISQSQAMNTALGIGCYPVSDLHAKPPGKILNVQAKIKGDRMELTWDYDGDNKNVREYEIHIFQEGKRLPATRSTEKSVILCSPIVIPGKRYAFQIRPISKSGNPGCSSEDMKIRFLTAAPAAPSTPYATACSIHEIEITVTYPREEECNGSPVTHCIVELFNTDDNNCNKWTRLNQYELHEGAYAPKVFKETINGLQEYCTYEIRVCFANNAGESPPSKSTSCKTLEPVPGPPTRFRFSSYRKAHMIKLRWNIPDMYPRFVHRYEIEFRERTLGGPKWKTAGETGRLSLRVKELSQDTRYYFRIRSISEGGKESVWTHEIDETTRFSKLSKAALAPLAFVGGTVGAPAIGAAGGVVKTIEDEEKVSAKAVAKGTGLSVGLTLGLTLIAPMVGAAMVYGLITEGDEYSEQSDED